MASPVLLKDLLRGQKIKDRFNSLLGENSEGFISSIIQIQSDNKLLAKAAPQTIMNAAVTAAVLKLPISKNLGFAWIVPYNGAAQFQIGYKGLIQLAKRSGQYKTIDAFPVYSNQFKSFDYSTSELKGDFTLRGEGEAIGYCAYFYEKNGFWKRTYWTREEVEKHGKRYSKAFTTGPWSTNFNRMALKTVLKSLLTLWASLSLVQTAIQADQSVQHTEGEYSYPDNEGDSMDYKEVAASKEHKRMLDFIESANSLEKLGMVFDVLPENDVIRDAYMQREADLQEPKKLG